MRAIVLVAVVRAVVAHAGFVRVAAARAVAAHVADAVFPFPVRTAAVQAFRVVSAAP